MDIVAKHVEPNEFGVRIAGFDKMYYRKKLWNHESLTDFWRLGRVYAKKLEENNMFIMGYLAICSIENEILLFKLFGVNTEIFYNNCNITQLKKMLFFLS